MTDARLRLFWHRAGPLCAIAALVAAGEATQGCGGGGSGGSGGSGSSSSSTSTSTTTSSSTSSSSSTSTSSSSGAGGSTPFTGTATVAGEQANALDATPDPEGVTIYFTAVDPIAGAGVFKVLANGSQTTPAQVQVGAPYAAPFGIASSTDGKTMYVSDPGALGASTLPDNVGTEQYGVIYAQLTAGGTPTVVAGTVGFETRGLEVSQVSNADVIYFTGHDPAAGKNGAPGLFSVPAAGGTVTTIAEGAPFNDPSGIAVGTNGMIYVVDTTAVNAPGAQRASVIQVNTNAANAATLFGTSLAVGYPAGIAISLDGTTLFVSSLAAGASPSLLTDQIAEITVSTMAAGTPITTSINTYTEAAGMHRAKTVDVFAWVDSSAGPMGGRVFEIH